MKNDTILFIISVINEQLKEADLERQMYLYERKIKLMRKLTKNQTNVISCLNTEYLQLKEICKRYAIIQAENGYNPDLNAWRGEVSICLNSLIKRNLVKYEYLGKYKLK